MQQLSDHDIKRIAAAVREGMPKISHLHREDASAVALAAARTAVQEHSVKLFAILGYDVANAEDIKKLRANLDFAAGLRRRSEHIGKAVSNAVAVAVALFFMGLLALGFKMTILNGHGPPPPPMSK